MLQMLYREMYIKTMFATLRTLSYFARYSPYLTASF